MIMIEPLGISGVRHGVFSFIDERMMIEDTTKVTPSTLVLQVKISASQLSSKICGLLAR